MSSISDALLNLSCKIHENLSHAAGLALAVAYCAANDQQIPAFVAGALAGDVAVKGVEGLCQMATGGASEAELLTQAKALVAEDNARPIEELAAVIASLKNDLAELPEALRQNLLAQIKNEQRELHEQWGRRVLDVVGALPFTINGTVAGLLGEVDRVRGHGLANVVDRPESAAIVAAFKSGRTNQVLLRGRALSGKTFLAFKTAQRWIASGGQVAWMRAGADISRYIAAIQNGAADAANLPLIVWEPSDSEPLRQDVFEQIRRYDGPVLIAVRVGGKQNHDDVLAELADEFGFAQGEWDAGQIRPAAERVSLFLGPIDKPAEVLSAMARAGGHGLTLTDEGKAALANLMRAGQVGQQTTLLGLGQACLMALSKQGVTRVDRQAVEALQGPERARLSAEQQVKNIFAHTVGADEKEFLTALRLYKQWTFSEGMHEEVLTATIQACCDAGRTMRDCRADLTERGVLTHAPPWYWVWHDLQLDVAPNQPDDTANDVLARTVEHLARSLACATNDQSKKTLAQAAGGFAAKLQQNGLWREALGLHDAALHARRNLAEAHVAGEEEASALAGTCNLGILLAEMGQRPAALALFQEALDSYRKLAREQPSAYNPDVALTCNNLGILLAEMGQRPEALARYKEALKIFRDLAREQPKAYNPNVALICNNLGALFFAMGQRPEALALYQEALNVYRELALEQPRAYLPYVATTCNNLGILLKDMGQRPEALELYKEALKIYRDLAREQPKAYNPDVAATRNNLGNLLADMGQRPAALELYREALKIRRDLAREQPKAYNPDVADTCNNLGLLLVEMKQHAEAAKLHAEALVLHYACWLELPAAYEERVGYSLSAINELTTNTEFSGRQQWLAELWRGMLGRFGGNLWLLCLPLCQTFAEAGLPALAMEPYVLLAITLEKQQDPAAAAQAAALVESLRPALGAEFEPLRQGLRAKFARLLAE